MMRKLRFGLGAVALLAACAGTASATPLRLDYCVDVLPSGLYKYTFTLTVDNHDNSWAPGQAWRWLIFGDQNGAPSPLTSWADDGTVWPVGPWTGYSSSGGGHNGPTMNYVLDYWTPAGVGDSLTWTGTSNANLQEPDMLFSTIAGTLNGGIAADFEVAHRLASCSGQIVGACCRTNGTCFPTTSGNCTSLGGIYRGDNTACATANCPAGGACCMALGACSTLTSAACTAANGSYRGDGTSCATAACPGGFTMDCSIPGTFTDISATGTQIGSGDDNTFPFTSSVTNALITNANLYACTNGFISDSSTFADYTNTTIPHTASGLSLALYPNWNDLYVDGVTGFMLHEARVEGGVPVEIIEFYNVTDCCGGGPTGTFEIKIFGAGGPALAQFLYQDMSWDQNGANSTVGVQWAANVAYQASFNVPGSIPNNAVCSIVQTGAPASCYANCDHSTTQPCLNVLDFGCFLNAFSSGNTYANCDNSTTNPVLNVLDFGCFLNKFAAGCSSC